MILIRSYRPWRKWLIRFLAVALAAYVLAVLLCSQFMVSPPRLRVSESARPVLGVFMDVDTDRSGEPGVRIRRTVSPAREAGLRAGDVILRVNDQPVLTNADVTDPVRAGREGETVRVQARRTGPGGETGILVDVPLAYRPVSPADHGLEYRDVAFTDPGGRILRGWYVPAPPGPGPAPAVVYGHGNGGDRRHWLPVAWEVHQGGIAQLFIDFAGRGESEGSTITLGAREAEAMISAMDFLQGLQEIDGDRLALAGRSMGAAAAALAAGRDGRVRALVLDSPFSNLVREVDHALRSLHLPPALFRGPVLAVAAIRGRFEPYEVVPVDAMETYLGPVLLFHGQEDESVPMADALEFKDRAGPRLELHLLDGQGHNGRRPEPYEARIVAFLREHLQLGP